MGTEFVGTTPWKRISAALASAGPRAAAIAYLGIDGPRLLRGLRRGDLLVVNASKEAVASHATSPAAIATLMARGVTVKTSARLHAKVAATADRAVIGSANASAHSQASDEAVVITDVKSLVRETRDYIDAIAVDATLITEEYLQYLQQVWDQAPRATPLPGVNAVSAETGLLPRRVAAVMLVPTEYDDLTTSERAAIAETIEDIPEFPVDAFQLPDGDTGYPIDTVLLRYDDTRHAILRPAVTYSQALSPIPTRGTGTYQLIREQRGHRSRKTAAIRAHLSPGQTHSFNRALAAGTDVTLPPALSKTLLALWKVHPSFNE
ncbi:phosphatidylserine/phosphatidylglycerophosphate/cardiolipin synthase family protein [Nocardia gipuzkoensis]|uniref:phosphatidylserine/phosphatidylglycerophosphate/ cardiolipin synthase family protein n=1 Tax=Nocardia gipuzkoensis TaxID=2749991 RepID=UPI00237E5DAA|nr:phosphatidylserine/phosphatidylglycerophosphate/cardiolipin synthase family protein [Nocardia gipuzkoensis]MDE1675077.1 phosphatidylserine/phosphatidylglycerophosphate/cardiolipin synthase family protein [Nocardia gipuzkoensis]